ncbi:MAG: hypothetical protein NTY64_16265 [Deltaproteobacteria bacterium]|nr:hypothetical protein [Deltaproteobacteria bacterium]
MKSLKEKGATGCMESLRQKVGKGGMKSQESLKSQESMKSLKEKAATGEKKGDVARISAGRLFYFC